jgi:hypothetical protein
MGSNARPRSRAAAATPPGVRDARWLLAQLHTRGTRNGLVQGLVRPGRRCGYFASEAAAIGGVGMGVDL